MANYNDKTNMEMLKLICDAVKLFAELEKMGGITLLMKRKRFMMQNTQQS